MLRQHGFNVVYFGQDVPLEDMVLTTAQEHPAMLCLSASSKETALPLRDMQDKLQSLEPPVPAFGYGGRAFDIYPELRQLVAGNYLGSDPRDALNAINGLIHTYRHP